MKTAFIVTGLTFGALTLAGCSSGSSDADFCAAYDDFNNSPQWGETGSDPMTTIGEALFGGDVTIAELNDAGSDLLAEVEGIAGMLNDMRASASDAGVKDALSLLSSDGLDSLREMGKVARDADDLATFADDLMAVDAESDEAAFDAAGDTIDAFYDKTCPVLSN